MKPILIIAAVPQETVLLEHALGITSRMKTVAYNYVEGTLDKQHIIICAAGIGKINAAATTAALIERYRPRLVINTGCAGAYPGSGLSIGDLAVASEELLGFMRFSAQFHTYSMNNQLLIWLSAPAARISSGLPPRILLQR